MHNNKSKERSGFPNPQVSLIIVADRYLDNKKTTKEI